MTAASVADLALEEELVPLKEVALSKGWHLERPDSESLVVELPAKDGSMFALWIDCSEHLLKPPAIHWYNRKTDSKDKPCDTPRQGGFFHGSGVICAPWNRLAYKQVNSVGPHGDWDLANWKTNPKTGGAKTLCAMVLRIFAELHGPHYKGRMG